MERYVLGQSALGFISDNHREEVLDLQLEKNSYYYNALIYGNVLTLQEKPIKEAKISFYDVCNNKIGTVYSSNDGFYTFFKVNLYTKIKIITKKEGYQTDISDLLKICSRKINYDVYLRKTPLSKQVLISGYLTDSAGIPLEGVNVYLLTKLYKENKVYKVTTTNSHGQFVFANIPLGLYRIFVNDPEFAIYNKPVKITGCDKIFNINIKLKEKTVATRIMGQITDDNNDPIPYAVVVLYKIDNTGTYIPTAHTVCDQEGAYCFSNVSFADYVVKAKI